MAIMRRSPMEREGPRWRLVGVVLGTFFQEVLDVEEVFGADALTVE